jgi:transcriptional regulator with XRE-family HTH domain
MPGRSAHDGSPRAVALARRLGIELGRQAHDERRRRGWTLAAVAERASLSVAAVQAIESGSASSLDGYSRLAVALGLEARFALTSERTAATTRDGDAVHAATGEIEAGRLQALGHRVLLDEPYQHFQFAGRADVVAVDVPSRALLHIENRTRFPDIQAFAGAFAAKRAYLGREIAGRVGVAGGFVSETHVVVALWSAEVLHTLRCRRASFRSICPDPPEAFAAWWAAAPPVPGRRTELIVFDPLPGARITRRRWVGLDRVGNAEPRYRGYAEVLTALRGAGLA